MHIYNNPSTFHSPPRLGQQCCLCACHRRAPSMVARWPQWRAGAHSLQAVRPPTSCAKSTLMWGLEISCCVAYTSFITLSSIPLFLSLFLQCFPLVDHLVHSLPFLLYTPFLFLSPSTPLTPSLSYFFLHRSHGIFSHILNILSTPGITGVEQQRMSAELWHQQHHLFHAVCQCPRQGLLPGWLWRPAGLQGCWQQLWPG